MIKRLSKADYMKLAEDKGYIHLGTVPRNVKIKTSWKCERCGKVSDRTYRGVAIGNGCSCRSVRTLQPAHYRQLAKELGIIWVWDEKVPFTYPTNSKAMTIWQNPETGERVEASWHMLTHVVRLDIAEKLGLNDER